VNAYRVREDGEFRFSGEGKKRYCILKCWVFLVIKKVCFQFGWYDPSTIQVEQLNCTSLLLEPACR